MSNDPNIFLQGTSLAPPKNDALARWSFGLSIGSVVALLLARLYLPLIALHFMFVGAIVTGHLSLRRMKAAPHRYRGHGLALFGMTVGYVLLAFNVLVAALFVLSLAKGSAT